MGRHPFVTHPPLFTPIAIRDVSARNRVPVSPTCRYASVECGPTDRRLVSRGRCTLDRVGIVFAGKTAAEARGRKTYELAPRCAEICTR